MTQLLNWSNWRLGSIVKLTTWICSVGILIWAYTGTIITSQMSKAAEDAVVSILTKNGMDPATIKKMQADITDVHSNVEVIQNEAVKIKDKIGEIDEQTDDVQDDVKQLLVNQELQRSLVEKLLNKALGLPLDTPQ